MLTSISVEINTSKIICIYRKYFELELKSKVISTACTIRRIGKAFDPCKVAITGNPRNRGEKTKVSGFQSKEAPLFNLNLSKF